MGSFLYPNLKIIMIIIVNTIIFNYYYIKKYNYNKMTLTLIIEDPASAYVPNVLSTVPSESQPATRSTRCTIRADPVCGVNGVTYECGYPEAQCNNVAVAYRGAC